MKDVISLFRAIGRGERTFEEVKALFVEESSFSGRAPTQGGWDKVWERAERADFDDDIPAAVHAAASARYITAEQETELLAIWTAKVTQQE